MAMCSKHRLLALGRCSWLPALPSQRESLTLTPQRVCSLGNASIPPLRQAVLHPRVYLDISASTQPILPYSWASSQTSLCPPGHPCIPIGIPVASWASPQASPRPPRHSNTARADHLQYKSLAFSGLPQPQQARVNIPSSFGAGDTSQLAGGRPSRWDLTPRISRVSLAMFPTRDASSTGPWFGCGPPGKHHPVGMERGCPRLLLPCQKSWAALPHQGAPAAPGPGVIRTRGLYPVGSSWGLSVMLLGAASWGHRLLTAPSAGWL